MDTVALHELDTRDLREARAVINALAGRLRVLKDIERVAVAAMTTLEAVAPEAAADLKARLS
jgi:hypothetical protein